MANQIPIKVMCDGSGNTCGLAQFTSSDSVAVAAGGTGLTTQGICAFAQPGIQAVACKTTYIGICAGKSEGAADENTYVGYAAGQNVTTGCYHTIIGSNAGDAITTCSSSTLIGYNAGTAITFGDRNTAIGTSAGQAITTATDNTLVGYISGCVTTGASNTTLGACTLAVNTVGVDNVAIGMSAGKAQVAAGCNNTFVGSQAGEAVLCRDNTLMGAYAGTAATTGGGNTMIGACVGYGVVGGASNVYIGDKAGLANTSGNANVFIGNCAGCASTASCCLIIGNGVCDLITGVFNTGIVSIVSCVGIGTAAPDKELDVFGTAAFGNATGYIYVGNNGQSFSFNRDPTDGSISNSSAHAYQFQQTASATPTSDYLTVQVYDEGGTEVSANAFTINGAANIGIGTSSPDTAMHIYNGSAGSVTAISGAALTIEDDAASYLQFLNPADTEAGIIFGRGTDNNHAGMFYGSDEQLYFTANNAERLRISSAGSLSLGATSVGGSPGAGSVEFHKDANNYVRFWDNATATFYMQSNAANAPTTAMKNSDSDSLDITTFQRTNAGGNLYGQSRNGLMMISGAPNGVMAVGTSNATSLVLGTNNTERMRIFSDGNIGMNTTTIPAWDSQYFALYTGGAARGVVANTGASAGGSLFFLNNLYHDGSNWTYAIANEEGTVYSQSNGSHFFQSGASTSHSAGATASLTTALTIAKDGDVGIGTDAPDSTLHVYQGDSSATVDSTSDHLIVEDSGDVGISFLSGTTNYARMMFTDSTGTAGQIRYKQSTDNTDTLTFKVGGTEGVTFYDGGLVGIGTAAPATELHVVSASVGSPILRLENANADGNQAQLRFYKDGGSPADNDVLGSVEFWGEQSTNALMRYGDIYGTSTDVTNGNEDFALVFRSVEGGDLYEAMRLQGRNLGIGTTSPSSLLHIKGNTVGSETQLFIESAASANAGIRLRENGASKWTFANNNVDDSLFMYSWTKSGGGAKVVTISADGDVGIGTDSPTHKLDVEGYINANSGIQFQGDTAAANALDDYEEGTWTIGVSFGGGTTGIGYSNQEGSYTKIGRMVHVQGIIILSSKGSSTGEALVTGLPFTIANNNNAYTGAPISFNKVTIADQNSSYGKISSTQIQLTETTNAGTRTTLTNSDFANDSELFIQFTYRV